MLMEKKPDIEGAKMLSYKLEGPFVLIIKPGINAQSAG